MAWVWIGLALLVLVVEIMSGTVFLLFVSLGMLLSGTALFFEPELGFALQLLIFSVVVVIGLVIYMRSRKRKRFRADNDMNSLDVGNTVEVLVTGNRASYRGSSWDAELEGAPGELTPGRYQIVSVRGNTLLVKAVASPDAGEA